MEISANTDLMEIASQQRLVTDASARELAPLLTPYERAVVSMLATAEVDGVELKPLVDSFALETGNRAAEDFSSQLQETSQPLDVAIQIPGLLSLPTTTALQSARANGSLVSFYRSWLSQTVEDRINWVRHEDTHVAAFARLGLRSLFCVYWIGFILLFILPEFQKMNEEFGIDSSRPMAMLYGASDLGFKVLPFLLLTIFFLSLYILAFKRTVFRNYVQRWLPGRWQQVVLPKSILQRKLMAWDLQGFQNSEEKRQNEKFDWNYYVSKGLLTSSEASIMKSASGLETQSWLLRNMSENRLRARKDRFEVLVRFVIIAFQIIIAGFIILTALAIFSSLLGIMRGVA